ncbi:MAG: hypothetical protein ACI80V_000385 [Rhodothermales bacterium]|jgi:hypothetical protein
MQRLLSKAHLLIGLLGIIAFLGTGQYMDKYHGHLEGMDDAMRMLFRSTHLYILYASICNVALGVYEVPRVQGLGSFVQSAGSITLLLVPILLTVAFFTEPFLTDFARPYSRPAAYLALGGGLLLLFVKAVESLTGPDAEPGA